MSSWLGSGASGSVANTPVSSIQGIRGPWASGWLVSLRFMLAPENLANLRMNQLGPQIVPMPFNNQSDDQNKHEVREKTR